MNRRKRRNRNNLFIGDIIFPILIIVFLLALIIVFNIFMLTIDKFSLKIILNSIGSVAIFYYTFISPKRPNNREKIISILVALSLWTNIFLSTVRIIVIIDTVVVWLLIGWILFMFLIENDYSVVLNGEALCLIVLNLYTASSYTFKNDNDTLMLVLIAALIEIIAVPIVIILLNKRNLKVKSESKIDKLSDCIIISVVIFAVSLFTLWNMNFALDSSQPVNHETVIIETYYMYSSRGSNDYYFVLELDGKEIDFEVSLSEYKKYKEGDSFTIALYKGAFGVPYYISSN